MGTDRREVSTGACVSNNTTDGVRMERTRRRMSGQEQRPAHDSGTRINHIRCECLANIDRQRQAIDAVTLASNDDLSGPPVDAAEFKTSHFGRAQAEAR